MLLDIVMSYVPVADLVTSDTLNDEMIDAGVVVPLKWTQARHSWPISFPPESLNAGGVPLAPDCITSATSVPAIIYSHMMLMEPASKVSVPLTVVTRMRSRVPESVTSPPPNPQEVVLLFIE